MSLDAWPSPDARRGPLPRIDDLPLAEQGYEQEAVRRAFDDFYRHVAQLDATLKTLEAVDAFQREAAELRSDLRSLQSLGFSSAELSWEPQPYEIERESPHVSPAALRMAGEAALLIIVAVLLGIADVRPLVVVAVMAATVGVVWLCEWLAARSRTRVPRWIDEPYGYAQVLPAPAEAVGEPAGEPAPYVEAAAPDLAVGWSALEPVDEVVEEEPLPEDEPEEVAEPEEPRRGWLRRRRHEPEPEPELDDTGAPLASHVRVLPTSAPDEAPWERSFDGEDAGGESGPVAEEPDVQLESSDPASSQGPVSG
jgi:hypothetical protein